MIPTSGPRLKNNVYIVLVSMFGQLPARLHLRLSHLPEDRQVRRFWQGVLYMPAIISVIVIGIMWAIIFSPSGIIAEVMNRIYSARASTHKISQIFDSAGGFNVTRRPREEAHHRQRTRWRPRRSPIPPRASRASFSPTRPDQLGMLKHDLVNLLGTKWTPDFLDKAGRGHAPRALRRALVLDGHVPDPFPRQHAEDRHRRSSRRRGSTAPPRARSWAASSCPAFRE